jgi:hypothetical protein
MGLVKCILPALLVLLNPRLTRAALSVCGASNPRTALVSYTRHVVAQGLCPYCYHPYHSTNRCRECPCKGMVFALRSRSRWRAGRVRLRLCLGIHSRTTAMRAMVSVWRILNLVSVLDITQTLASTTRLVARSLAYLSRTQTTTPNLQSLRQYDEWMSQIPTRNPTYGTSVTQTALAPNHHSYARPVTPSISIVRQPRQDAWRGVGDSMVLPCGVEGFVQ